MPLHGNAGLMPLLACVPGATQGAAPSQAQVTSPTATAGSLTLAFQADDTDNDIAGFIVTREGQPRGRHRYSYREAGLTPDTQYSYQVTAYDGFGNEAKPVTFAATTPKDEVAPSQPEDFHTLNVTDQLAQLIWRGSKDEIGVTGYVIQRAVNDTDQGQELAEIKGTEYEDKTVEKGVKYVYRVMAVDAAGNRSQPAVVKVEVPKHAPYVIKQEAERMDDFVGSVKTNWYLFNLHSNCRMLYKGLELGRDKPFDEVTLRYAIPNDRAGAKIIVLLDPKVEVKDGKTSITGGQEIASFIVEGTGDWQEFKTFTQPAKIDKAGKHDVVLAIEQGESKVHNALVNIDWFSVGYANPPGEE